MFKKIEEVTKLDKIKSIGMDTKVWRKTTTSTPTVEEEGDKGKGRY